jgi:hypothetical protein
MLGTIILSVPLHIAPEPAQSGHQSLIPILQIIPVKVFSTLDPWCQYYKKNITVNYCVNFNPTFSGVKILAVIYCHLTDGYIALQYRITMEWW